MLQLDLDRLTTAERETIEEIRWREGDDARSSPLLRVRSGRTDRSEIAMGAERDLLEALARRVAALARGRDERELTRDLAARLGLETPPAPDRRPGPDHDDDLGLADELELSSQPADVPPTVGIDREFRPAQ
jgi:hypothetical protein